MIESLEGHRLGSYEVRELLGSGGMANVYKGYDRALDRNVAIKVISTAGQSADFVARFQREARVVARLRHPHIVQIYHFGEERGIVYMVQELLPGPTLQRRLREAGRRRIAAERVQSTITQLAEALDFAHSQGVIHRDVKPSNALYNAQGQLVLTDFGIARSDADIGQTSTGPGVVMGTPGYLAPEQAISSTALTPACDVYALGVVLFELLTGRLPFEADTPMGVILKHLYDEPPIPSSLRPDLPKALDEVVLRALDKEPTKRYPSAGALATGLRAAWGSNGRATTTEPLPPARPRAQKAETPKKDAGPARVRTTPTRQPMPVTEATPPPANPPKATTPRAKPTATPTKAANKTTPSKPITPPPTSTPLPVVASERPYTPWLLRIELIMLIAAIVSVLLYLNYNNLDPQTQEILNSLIQQAQGAWNTVRASIGL